MKHCFDRALFSKALRHEIGNLKLRDAGEAAGISASTLSRIVNGAAPAIDTFFALCDWMDWKPEEFIRQEETPGEQD